MKSDFKIALIITALIISLASCADKKSENYDEVAQRSFDKWMDLHVNIDPNNPAAKRLDNGMYIEWIEHAPASALKPAQGDWLRINYTGTALPDKYMNGRGRVFMTRDSLVAKQENTFSTYAHYVPLLTKYNTSYGLPSGFYSHVFKEIRKGDKVRVYIPGTKANSISAFTTTNGFGGNFGAQAGMSMIVDSLVITEIETNIALNEKNKVVEFAKTEWGMNSDDPRIINDDIDEDGNPKKKSDGVPYYLLYYQILETNRTGENPDLEKPVLKDKEGKDAKTKVNLWYAGRFLDGFLFDTNVDSIGVRYRRDTYNYAALEYTINSSDFITAFEKIFAEDVVTYDSHFRMVFTSGFGYGTTEKSNDAPSTIIQAYSPLIFDVWVDAKPDED